MSLLKTDVKATGAGKTLGELIRPGRPTRRHASAACSVSRPSRGWFREPLGSPASARPLVNPVKVAFP